MYRYKEANFYKYMIKITCMLLQYRVQNKYFGIRYFCRLFCICTFFVLAILVQVICLLGDSTGMPPPPQWDVTLAYKTNTHASNGWLVLWIIQFESYSSTDTERGRCWNYPWDWKLLILFVLYEELFCLKTPSSRFAVVDLIIFI